MQSDRVGRRRPQARVVPMMPAVTVLLREVAAARRAPAPSLPLMPTSAHCRRLQRGTRRMRQATVGSVGGQRLPPSAVIRTHASPAVEVEEPAAEAHVVTEECASEVGEAATVVPTIDREAKEVRARS